MIQRKRYRKAFLWIIALSLVIVIAGSGVIVVYSEKLAEDIEARFAGRRWRIPSKVYSDTTALFAGQTVNRRLLFEKLHRLGYREHAQSPNQQGEMFVSDTHIDLNLHDFQTPFFQQKSIPVRITFNGNQNSDRISAIIHRDNKTPVPLLELEPEELMRYFGPDRESRSLLSIHQMPPHLIHAIIAAEDGRFYRHHGVDFKGILRALITNLRRGDIAQGGSTITQQLAKNYFLTPERTIKRKLKELLIAFILEYNYEKDEILEIYLNEIYWGQKGSVSINGIGEASEFYFDKPVDELSVVEAATLAGLIKAPNYFSPFLDSSRCLRRRNTVLTAMQKKGWLNEADFRNAIVQPVRPARYQGYTRRAPYFMDYLTQQLTALYPKDALSSEGLSIFTTLDTQVQKAAEQALLRGLKRLEKSIPGLKREEPAHRLQGAAIVIQPKTGYILAMVGGRDYGSSQFNRATHARRQPGSAFKPFVYLVGLEKFTALSRLPNKSQAYLIDGRRWQPKNFDKNAEPVVSFRQALAESQNLATVNLTLKIGLKRIVDEIKPFKLSGLTRPYPALALGALEVTPLELARAYCVFAADGVQPHPLSLKEVVNENGKIIEKRHTKIERLISPAKAFMISNLLRSVVTDGTARSLKNLGIEWPVAGKTGTTNNSRDAWFIGYTPEILALVWVGFDNGDTLSTVASQVALPIWAELIKAIPQYMSGEWLDMPPGVVKRRICPSSRKLAVTGICPNPVEEIFLEQTAPDVDCNLHVRQSPLRRFWKGIKKIVPRF
jgi:penicillin-binding protein 1B